VSIEPEVAAKPPKPSGQNSERKGKSKKQIEAEERKKIVDEMKQKEEEIAQ